MEDASKIHKVRVTFKVAMQITNFTVAEEEHSSKLKIPVLHYFTTGK